MSRPASRPAETAGPRAGTVAAAFQAPRLQGESFQAIARLVAESCGIAMGEVKQTMLETRLRRRLQVHGLDRFEDYVALLQSAEGASERQAFTDCVVTNQTSFFREPPHFDHLTAEELTRLAEGGRERALRMWSVAASSGQEAYSLAMIADEASQGGRRFPWSIVATDISVTMLKAVRAGVYDAAEGASVPDRLRRKYLIPRRDGRSERVEVSPELRRNVRPGQINLMHETYRPGSMMDLVFCRNVLIYFKPDVQLGVVTRLCRHVRPGGLLVLGHSESVRSNSLPLRALGSNIYERMGE